MMIPILYNFDPISLIKTIRPGIDIKKRLKNKRHIDIIFRCCSKPHSMTSSCVNDIRNFWVLPLSNYARLDSLRRGVIDI